MSLLIVWISKGIVNLLFDQQIIIFKVFQNLFLLFFFKIYFKILFKSYNILEFPLYNLVKRDH
jgi:hypothetical protein